MSKQPLAFVKRFQLDKENNCAQARREVYYLELFKNNNHIVNIQKHILTETEYIIYLEPFPIDLFEVVNINDGLREEYAVLFFEQIKYAVKYMHDQNVVHRDIKLENCLVKDLHVVLCDLEFAETMDDRNTLIHDFKGSYSFCAPELFVQVPYNPFLADYWSMGICFFAMICNFLPFEAAHIHDNNFNCFLKFSENIQSMAKCYSKKINFSDMVASKINSLLKVTPKERHLV
jgi:serine/threonine protein kinase